MEDIFGDSIQRALDEINDPNATYRYLDDDVVLIT